MWELQIKVQLHKLNLRLPLAEFIKEQEEVNAIEVLPVSLAHVLALDILPSHHKDPFDRLLIAQANAEGISLVSADEIFRQYPVSLLW